jgi:hypothetical protein
MAPDGKSLIDVETASDAGAPSYSAYLRGVTPGAAATLLGASTAVTSQPFTADRAYVLLYEGAPGTSALAALAVGGGAPANVATGMKIPFVPLRHSQELGTTSAGDGVVFDASGSASPWIFSPSVTGRTGALGGAKIVYTTTASPAGLYVVASP